MNGVRVAIAQLNTVVGDVSGNTQKILFCIEKAIEKDSDLIVFPELALTGYPPEDLLLKPYFIKENLKCLNRIAKTTKNIIAVVGFVDKDKGGIYNSAGILSNNTISYVYHKRHLPNYGVFDEKRYFKRGSGETLVLKARDFSFAVNICEDIWISEEGTQKGSLFQADFLINISASPYYLDKIKERRDALRKNVRKIKSPIVYCNLIGGQDELVFDGRSMVFDGKGSLIANAKAFEEDLIIVDLPIYSKRYVKRGKGTKIVSVDYRSKKNKTRLSRRGLIKDVKRVEEVYLALILGVQDYVRKNNFRKVALGLSGGIDSALVTCIAVDALEETNVLAISMPSVYSSSATQDDAERISRNLGIRFVKIPIDDIFNAYNSTLGPHFMGMNPDVTEENIQARIRGNVLMAFSNKFGYLVLNTGNKSETSVGYCTLYGDMAGGFAVIKDVPKSLIYELARYVNNKKGRGLIPDSVFKRPPSAELRPGQEDQDTLPSYGLLDRIIDLYIEKNKTFGYIVTKVGHKDVVRDVLRMVDRNEYKRRQSAPGIKITPKAFGKDRRMPITNKFSPLP
ncbi:NAD+ synthase [Candidatus Omnitrophota bacterium]